MGIAKNPRVSKASLHRGYKSVTKESGTTFTGRWTPSINVRGSRAYENERNQQLLRHISVQLFHYVRNKLGMNAEQEIQAMYYNDRIVISANDDATLTRFYQDLKQKAKAYLAAAGNDQPNNPLTEILTTPQHTDQRTTSHAKKLSAVLDDSRIFSLTEDVKAVEALKSIALSGVLGDMFVSKMDMAYAADCKKKLTDLAYIHRIIVMQNGGQMHAEQKLVIALWKAKGGGRSVIYGKKRPCTGCFAALSFARQKLGMQIAFNVRPGGYWSTSNEGLMILVREGIAAGKVTPKSAHEWYENFKKSFVSHQTHSIPKGESRHKLKGFSEAFGGKVMHDTDYGSDSDSDTD